MDVIERIKRRISLVSTEACGYTPLTKVISLSEVEEILEQETENKMKEKENGYDK